MTKRTVSMLCVLAAMATSVAVAAEAPPSTKARRAVKAPAAKGPAGKAAPSGKATATTAPPARKLAPPAKLPLAQIIDRNIAARGGLASWRAVTGVTMAGELDAGGKQATKLPFVMSMKRPHKSRLELTFRAQTAVQVWNGTQGWKVRPYLDRDEVEPFTAAEAKSAAAAAELDGPLVDYAKKGTHVALAGTDVVEGRNTYRLELTLKSGEKRSLWIDAATFLEAKIDGEPRRMDGRLHRVSVFYRDYKRVAGLQFPHTLETVVENVKGSHKIAFKTIKVNPALDDALFARPALGPGKLAAR